MELRSKQIMGAVLVLIALGACSPGSGVTNTARAVSGTLADWPGGTATVTAVVTNELGGLAGFLGADSALADNGSFSMELPETVDESLLVSGSIAALCQGTFDGTATPSTWSEAYAEFAVQQNSSVVGFLVQASSVGAADFSNFVVGDFVVARSYSDRALVIDGTCTSQFGSIVFDIDVAAGWSILVFEATQVVGGNPVGLRVQDVAAVPSGAEWFLVTTAAN